MSKDLFFTKDHEWVKFEGDVCTVGITEFAQSELGELVFIELPEIGKSIKVSESICIVESTKAASDVYAPVSGTVIEVNSNLKSNATLVNTSPYIEGWMVKLSNFSKTNNNLMNAEEYSKYLEK